MSDERSSVPQACLLAQMDLLMAALNADLSALDAELLDSGGRVRRPGRRAGVRGGGPGVCRGGFGRRPGNETASSPGSADRSNGRSGRWRARPAPQPHREVALDRLQQVLCPVPGGRDGSDAPPECRKASGRAGSG